VKYFVLILCNPMSQCFSGVLGLDWTLLTWCIFNMQLNGTLVFAIACCSKSCCVFACMNFQNITFMSELSPQDYFINLILVRQAVVYAAEPVIISW